MPNLVVSQIPVNLVFALISLIFLILFLVEYISRRNLVKKVMESSVDRVDQQSRTMILEATKKAETIISQAQELSTTTISQAQKKVYEIEQQYQQQYQLLFDQLSKQMTTDLNNQETEFVAYLDKLKTNSTNFQTQSSQVLEQRINQLIENFEHTITDFFTQTQQKSVQSIDLELKSARQLIDAYRQKQLTLIDDNIIAVLERTLSLVLTKNLSLKDQVDLVNEALEQAKVEKFIV